MRPTALWLTACLGALPAVAGASEELARPVRLLAGDAPIGAEVGHAAPFVHDLDGDGKRDLLVGQMGGGRLFVWRNEGTDAAPAFKTSSVFRIDGQEARVEAG